MRIIIVDDDQVIIHGLMTHIRTLGEEYNIIATADNGISALELVHQHTPDLLISDVKMPGMDGIALARRLRQENNDVRILMLSGFDDYAYLRSSIQYSAVDYLLKPIDLEEFDNILKSEAERLSRQKQAVRDTRRHGELEKAQKLYSYLTGEHHRFPLPCPLDISNFFIAVFFAKSSNSVPSAVPLLDFKDWAEKALEAQADIRYLSCTIGSTLVVLAGTTNQHSSTPLTDLLASFCGTLPSNSEITITGAVSEEFSDLNQSRGAYSHAKDALLQKFYRETGCMYHTKTMPAYSKSIDSLQIRQLSEQISYQVVFGKIPQLVSAIHELFSYLNRCSLHPQKYIECLKLSIQVLYNEASGLQELCQASESDCFSELLDPFSHCTAVEQVFTQTLVEKALLYQQQFRLKNNQFIEAAKNYIKSHYMEQITLQDVAEYTHLTYSYLSELFKEKTSMTFSDYLTKTRLQAAKKLLAVPHMKIYEIADQTGYLDSTSFTRAFKKYAGISPSEYRRIVK